MHYANRVIPKWIFVKKATLEMPEFVPSTEWQMAAKFGLVQLARASG